MLSSQHRKPQALANEEPLAICVCILLLLPCPWKKIPHRLFSFLSIGLLSQATHLPDAWCWN
jgi:hypothetical protein